jgi:competence protein ComEA
MEDFMQKKMTKLIVIIVLSVITCLTGCEKDEEMELETVSVEGLDEKGVSREETEVERETIYVHVCGEVKCPGVYELEAGSRVYEAIEAAGGVTSKAAEDALNQAEILEDGQKIQVLSKEAVHREQQNTDLNADGKMNINSASKEELMTLPGVGESKADAIIRYRSENGNFKSIEEIMEIEGIKEGVFKKIEDQITVS